MTLFTPPANPPKRLSVSAMRDWNRCSWYFKLGRIDKIPEDRVTHHRWAGSVVHSAFMLAYGTPNAPAPGDFRNSWTVDNAGSIEDALELFDMLWDGELIETGSEDLIGTTRAQDAFEVLKADAQLTPPDARDFAFGRVKALKEPNHERRKAAYKDYFRAMLETSLETGLMYDVVALEQQVDYTLGGVAQLGFVDIVMRKPSGGLVVVDLKTGATCPTDKMLAFDEQMNAYYTAEVLGELPEEVWYSHMKSGTIMRVQRNVAQIQALHEAAPMIMAQIEEGRFVKRVSGDCASCSRRQSCMGL